MSGGRSSERSQRRHRAMPKGIYPSQVFPAMQRGFGIPCKHPTSKSNRNRASTRLASWHLCREITEHGALVRSHRPQSPNPKPRDTASAPCLKSPRRPPRSTPKPSAKLTQPQSPLVTWEEELDLPRTDGRLYIGVPPSSSPRMLTHSGTVGVIKTIQAWILIVKGGKCSAL